MKKLWKIYDLSLVFIVVAVCFCAVTLIFDRNLAIIEFVSVFLFAIGKFWYHKTKKEKLLHKIKTVSSELDFSEGKAFERLSVACTVIEEDGTIIWLNDSFKTDFRIDDSFKGSNLKDIVRRDNLEKLLLGGGFKIKIDALYFSVYSSEIDLTDEKIYLLYFFDETKLRLTEKEYYDSRPSIMLSVIDNADEIYQNFKESDCAAIFSRVEQIIDDWATSYGALCRKFSNARMLIFVEERSLQRMINDKFSILDKVRDFTYEGKNTDITLSIGVGKEDKLIEANNSARQALDMAQSRGGDQVAVKHEAQYKFFGGVSAGHEKKNKVRTRLIAKTIAEIINDSENVLIMGHRFSDFDAFGSAVGMYCIANHFGKKANIVLNQDNTLALPLVKKFTELKGDGIIISPSESKQYAGTNTLLIVVDTHKKDFTENPELVDMATKVMVIDHHRKSVGYIEETVMFYHMPNSSSASEMVTEIAQYVDSKPVIDPFAALALFSGIMLDTRNFILRAGVRTFEAAAYLRSRGANTVDSKKLFSNDMEIFRHRNAIIDAAYTYKECAISLSPDGLQNVRLITSQACDEMLNIEGVKASFVLYQNGKGVNISARSYGEINVQLIMEDMGGGGHQTMSACQLADTDMIEAEIKLQNAIDNYLSNI
ncbi:MAG: DHH family phosphoesterase [Clostridia bacterium]|nr:DHH family phosphoesterase [Clostridia bacterium]